jgi:glycogen debranching enzyme
VPDDQQPLHRVELRREVERQFSRPGRAGDPDRPYRSGANVDIRHPRVFVLHEGYTVLVCQPGGSIGGTAEEGLFDFDTRLLSWWQLRLDGQVPDVVSNGMVDSRHWLATLKLPAGGDDAYRPHLPQDTIEVRIHRRLGPGMEERIRLVNRSMAGRTVRLSLDLGADFADGQEASNGERRHVGETTLAWNHAEGRLTLRNRAERQGRRFHRAIRVRLEGAVLEAAASRIEPRGEGAAPEPWLGEVACRLETGITLAPREERELRITYESFVDGAWRRPLPLEAEPDNRTMTARDREREDWRGVRTALETTDHVLGVAFDRAAEDLFDLRNWDLEGDSRDSWIPNAGVPVYSGVFGRDILIAGWQATMLGPEALQGALRWCAKTQGRRHDDFHEEQPGRMIHEIRRGPLSELGIIPQRALYAAHTTSSLFPLALAEHWHWTGRTDVLRQYLVPARRAVEWALQHGDLDGDGFLEYETRSEEGLKNESWKDSTESIRYADGRQVENPLAPVEEQAFHIAALERLAEICLALGEAGEADELLARASQLRGRWHEAYWLTGEGYYATALDPDKQPVTSVTSNAGHALTVGVVPLVHARQVANRLMASDMFSGWGVRTLSSRHPSYNPLAYHLGSVWPFENAQFVHGFRRYGLDEHAERLFTALFIAAGHFEGVRLPELFGGQGRDEVPVPVIYPDSNVPQAWTASGIAMLVGTMLGVTPIAPARTLAIVRPRLPAWLPGLVLRNLRVGDATVSLRFVRSQDGTVDHDVVAVEGDLHVIRSDAGGHAAELSIDGPVGEPAVHELSTGSGWGRRIDGPQADALAVGLAGMAGRRA